MIKLLTVIGARPQIIKAAALSRAIKNEFEASISEVILHTGQHYDDNMSKVFFDELGIPYPNYNLGIGSGRHGRQTAEMILAIEEVLIKESPDFVILYGDTNSTLAGAVAASKMHIPVVHIEAGLRSFNKSMPEEINRIVCDHCSTYLFTPTQTGYENLLKEGFRPGHGPFTIDNPGVFLYGDIMYDNSLYFSTAAERKSAILKTLNVRPGEFVLATVHRDYNTDNDEALAAILQSFNTISNEHDIEIVFPAHPRTLKRIATMTSNEHIAAFLENKRVKKIEPVSFLDMILLEKNASMIMTDSGGVQKEAYFFHKPCVILRPETEWIEVLDTGCAILAGSSYDKIVDAYQKLDGMVPYEFPAIFGKGDCAERICKEILNL